MKAGGCGAVEIELDGTIRLFLVRLLRRGQGHCFRLISHSGDDPAVVAD
jgi:hypothetical protein